MIGADSQIRHIVLLIILGLAMALPGLSSLPVIDRDEARYVQASVQMAQSGDWINIRFQDEARNKKPAGIYWLQTAALKTFSRPDDRKIWVHRLPSVFGALLAILATYWGGAKLISRDAALISAALLATSLLFVFEAHIAKTDAVLCGLAACVLASLAALRARTHDTLTAHSRLPIWLFWLALGASIMIKGPILLGVTALALAALLIWERRLSWAKPLLSYAPIVVFFLIWLPWTIAIYDATDGAFFKESLGQDLGGKLIAAQESHPGPPGYHLAFIWVMMWPASLFLLPAAAYAISELRPSSQQKRARALTPAHLLRYDLLILCVVWIVPFWLLIELMPTKLPHYGLVLYPAICLLIGASLSALKQAEQFKTTRRIGAVLFLTAGLIITGALVYVSFTYGQSGQKITASIMALLCAGASIYALKHFLSGHIYKALSGIVCAALTVSLSGYLLILPKLESFNLSARTASTLGQDIPRLSGTSLLSPTYTEPSLVYHLGTQIILGGQADPLDVTALKQGRMLLIDRLSESYADEITKVEALVQHARASGDDICLQKIGPISGMNYAKGKRAELYILKPEACPL